MSEQRQFYQSPLRKEFTKFKTGDHIEARQLACDPFDLEGGKTYTGKVCELNPKEQAIYIILDGTETELKKLTLGEFYLKRIPSEEQEDIEEQTNPAKRSRRLGCMAGVQ